MLARLGADADDVPAMAADGEFMRHLSSLLDDYGGLAVVSRKPKIAHSLVAMSQMMAAEARERRPALHAALLRGSSAASPGCAQTRRVATRALTRAAARLGSSSRRPSASSARRSQHAALTATHSGRVPRRRVAAAAAAVASPSPLRARPSASPRSASSRRSKSSSFTHKRESPPPPPPPPPPDDAELLTARSPRPRRNVPPPPPPPPPLSDTESDSDDAAANAAAAGAGAVAHESAPPVNSSPRTPTNRQRSASQSVRRSSKRDSLGNLDRGVDSLSDEDDAPPAAPPAAPPSAAVAREMRASPARGSRSPRGQPPLSPRTLTSTGRTTSRSPKSPKRALRRSTSRSHKSARDKAASPPAGSSAAPFVPSYSARTMQEAPSAYALVQRIAASDERMRLLRRAQQIVRRFVAVKRLDRVREQLRRRLQVVRELLSTEESFVSQLEEIRDLFMVPLKQSGAVSDNDHRLLFSNVPLLHNLHSGLRDDLRHRVGSWSRASCVGDVFLKLVPFLKMHTEYVKNYDQAVEKLKELRGDKAFSAFMRERKSEKRAGLAGEQYLATLLIAPIQRIPRYQLLLTEVCCNAVPSDWLYTDAALWQCRDRTPPLHDDYDALGKAVDGVRAVASHINETKKADDGRRRIAALQRRMQGSIERISWLSVEGRLLRHQYQPKSFNRPTSCGACKRLIWGLRNKGYQWCVHCCASLVCE